MKLKRYSNFIKNESFMDGSESFSDILNLPLDQRKEIKDGLLEISDIKKNESFSVNEELDAPNLGDFFSDMYKSAVSRLKKWLGKKAVAFLINQSQSQLDEKINMLRMLDPTDLTDIESTEVIYLGGGIDKTSEEGATGWRDMIEEFFGMNHVVRGEDMISLAKDGKLNKSNYSKPLIMNPMRNELVRTNDPRFSEIFRKWKSGELNKETDHDDWKYWANVINKEIHAPDLRIVNACDTNLVKLDPAAGAGTMGEMQVSALRGHNLFVWLDNGYKVQDISPWLIPTVTKLVRSEEELQLLLVGINKMNNGTYHVPTGEQKVGMNESWKIKKFSDFSKINEDTFGDFGLKFPSGVDERDVERWEKTLTDMLNSNDLDDRMRISDELLQDIQNTYPEIYDDFEEVIQKLTTG